MRLLPSNLSVQSAIVRKILVKKLVLYGIKVWQEVGTQETLSGPKSGKLFSLCFFVTSYFPNEAEIQFNV